MALPLKLQQLLTTHLHILFYSGNSHGPPLPCQSLLGSVDRPSLSASCYFAPHIKPWNALRILRLIQAPSPCRWLQQALHAALPQLPGWSEHQGTFMRSALLTQSEESVQCNPCTRKRAIPPYDSVMFPPYTDNTFPKSDEFTHFPELDWHVWCGEHNFQPDLSPWVEEGEWGNATRRCGSSRGFILGSIVGIFQVASCYLGLMDSGTG